MKTNFFMQFTKGPIFGVTRNRFFAIYNIANSISQYTFFCCTNAIKKTWCRSEKYKISTYREILQSAAAIDLQ